VLALVLALPALFQDPILELDPLVQQAYYSALHQLEVEGAVQSAAHNFAVLAQVPDLLDKPGPRALVLAQAYRAHLLLGESARAQEYLKEAMRLADGGPFELRVAAIVEQTLAARPPAQELDRDFYVLVRDALLHGNDSEDLLRRYGRRALPYLAEYLRELEAGDGIAARVGGRPLLIVMRLGLPQADAQFMKALGALTAKLDAALLEQILRAGIDQPPVDAEAAAAVDGFLVALSRSADVRRARLGATLAARILWGRRSPELEARIGEILSSSNDLLAPFVVGDLVWKDGAYSDTGQQGAPARGSSLARVAAHSPQSQVADLAIEQLWLAGQHEVLREFAQERGARADWVRYLSSLLPSPHGGSKVASRGKAEVLEFGQTVTLNEALRGEIARELGYSGRLPLLERALSAGERTLLRDRVQNGEPLVALLAAAAAIDAQDGEILSLALARRDLPHRKEFLQGVPTKLPPGVEAALLPLLDEPELAPFAAAVLSLNADRLAFADWLRVDALLSDQARPGLADSMRRLTASEPGLDVLQALLEAETASRKTRELALLLLAPHRPLAIAAGLAWPDAGHAASPTTHALATLWAPAAAEEAVRKGRLEKSAAQGFARLLATMASAKDRNSRRNDFQDRQKTLGQSFGTMLDAGVNDAERLVKEAIADSEPRQELVNLLSFGIDASGNREQPWRVDLFLTMMKRDPELADRTTGPWLGGGFDPRYAVGIERAIPPLLTSRNLGLRSRGLAILNDKPELVERNHDFLIPLLHDGDFAVQAAELMVAHSTREDVADWLEVAWNLPTLRNRSLLLRSMGRLQDERLVPILLGALADPDDKVSAAANTALERIRAVREQRETWEAWRAQGSALGPVPALLRKLGSENREVRIAAIRSLGVLEAPEALPALVELLESKDPGLVEAAREALQAIHASARRDRGVGAEAEVPVEVSVEPPVEAGGAKKESEAGGEGGGQ